MLTAEDSLADASIIADDGRLEEIQNLARKKLEKLSEARISFSLCGRRVVARELVQKAIRTVTAFKSIIATSLNTRILESKRFRNIVFSPDSSFMAFLRVNGGVQAVDSTTFQEMITWETKGTANLEFSPNSQIISLSDSDPRAREPTLEFWNLPRRTLLWRTTIGYSSSLAQSYPAHVKFSPSGQVAAYRWECRTDRTEREWNLVEVGTGKEEKVHHKGQLVFHPESHPWPWRRETKTYRTMASSPFMKLLPSNQPTISDFPGLLTSRAFSAPWQSRQPES